MNMSEFKSEDYLRIKWPIVLLCLSVVAVALLFFILNKVTGEADRSLRNARNDLNSAQTALNQIEQEETTITEYIGRYRDIEKAGMISGENRLAMQDDFAKIREKFSLFPIQLDILEQKAFTLPYDTTVYQAGRPIDLDYTDIKFSLPLLHEDDLTNLMDSLLALPQLLVPQSCKLHSNIRDRRDLLRLGQHLSAECTMKWFTFAIQEDGEQQ